MKEEKKQRKQGSENSDETKRFVRKTGVLRIVNIAVSGLCFCFTFGLFLAVIITGNDPYHRMLSYVMTSLLFAAPFLLELVLIKKKFRFSDFVLTFYVCYILIAGLIGTVFMVFDNVYGYDKAVHSAFGYVGSLVGLFLVCKLSDYPKLHPVFIAIVCFSVSMMLGAVWEIIEFSADNLLGQAAQGNPVITVDGTPVTAVTDTMFDIICNLGGAGVFIIHFIIHRTTTKNLLLGSIIKDFSARPNQRTNADAADASL